MIKSVKHPETQSGYEPPERLQGLPTWLTAQAARRAQAVVAEVLSKDGVRRQHFSVLSSLAERGPASQAEIGRRLLIDRSDLHELLNELEQRGLVARERDQHDRRRNVVALTVAGSGALDRLAARVEEAQDAYLEPLDDSERAELTRLLRKLAEP
jgi:DNA-binding MarR family transcriptional regulator